MARKNGTAKQPAIVQPQVPLATNPLGVKSVYSNNMDVTAGPLDVRLDFHEILPDQGKLVRERRASVVMSVPHFRAMMKLLNDQMAKLNDLASQFEKALAK